MKLTLVRLLAFMSGLSVLAPAGLSATPSTVAAMAPGLSPADAQQLLTVLNDPKKRAAFVITLSNLAKALKPATPSAKAAAAAGLAPDSLGAELLTSAGSLGAAVTHQVSDLQRALHDFRDLGPWLQSIVGDPVRRKEVLIALARLAVVLAASLATVIAANRALTRPIRALSRWSSGGAPVEDAAPDAAEPTELPGEDVDRRQHSIKLRRLLRALARLPFGFAHLLLELLPIVGFALVAFVFQIAGFLGNPESRLVVATALRCFFVAGALIAILNTLFAPDATSLRLVLVNERAAKLITFWFRVMLLVGAWGFSSIFVMQTLGLSSFASLALVKALMFVEHTLLACLIVQSRRDVARRLHPPRRVRGVVRRILTTLAERWWVYAVVLDYALWFIWALNIKNGYAQLWAISLKTFVVLIGARLLWIAALGGMARGMRLDRERDGRHQWARARLDWYYPMLRRLVTISMFLLTVTVLLQVWGVDVLSWFDRGALGDRLFSALISILVSSAVGVLIWEAVNMSIERHIERLGRDPINGSARIARVRTLTPILRIILSVMLVTVFGLTVLSEIGVNIAPLLGGAGIIGVAIGFGSQKLVQDFITGIFLLLENTMQVGDWVTAGGLSGSVEHLSIRTIRLRAGDGSVHMIPFSSVTTVTNTNRGLGNAPVSVDIDPGQDTDHAAEVLKGIALTMRQDPDYKNGMLSDLQYWGVDKVSSQAVTLVGQIVCTDKARYGVQREYNRRLRIAFAEQGIKLAVPAQTITLEQDTQDRSGRLPAIEHDDGSETVTESPPTAALGHGA